MNSLVIQVTCRDGTANVGRVLEVVTENDLEHLMQLFEGKAVEMEWQSMMERTTPNMAYQAWRHEPKVNVTQRSHLLSTHIILLLHLLFSTLTIFSAIS